MEIKSIARIVLRTFDFWIEKYDQAKFLNLDFEENLNSDIHGNTGTWHTIA